MSIPEMITVGFSLITIIFSVMIIINSYKTEKIIKRKIDELKKGR